MYQGGEGAKGVRAPTEERRIIRENTVHEIANKPTSENTNERTLIHPVAPFIFASSKPVYVQTVPMMCSMRLESDTVRSTNQSIPPGVREE